MKKFIALSLGLVATCVLAFAYEGVYNGVMLIGSNDKDFDLKTVEGMSGTINYNVELYTDGTNKQYCLRLAFDESKNYFMIPTHAILLMKTQKGDVIELRALYSYDDPGSDKVGYAYFPISKDQLSMISKDSIIKFRIQTIVGTDHRLTYAEKEWKTDSPNPNNEGVVARQKGSQSRLVTQSATRGHNGLGFNITKMAEDVNWQWDNKKSSFSASQKDIRSGF